MSTSTPVSTRFASLDGLRGVAAFVVLLHHIALLSPAFAFTYQAPDLLPMDNPVWWLSHTPLKLLTAGPEAVIVFFLLSGFVLTLEPLRKPDYDWIAYYPRRLVRLYVPIIASVVLAVVLILLVPRDPSRASSPWVGMLADPSLRPWSIIGEATVLFHPPLFPINGPLWSLVWEVWFSLLLPLAVAIVILVPRAWWVIAVISIALSGMGLQYEWEPMQYMPMFLVGAAMAAGIEDLRRAARWIDDRRGGWAIWSVLTIVGLILLVLGWIVRGTGAITTVQAESLTWEKIVGGAILLFCCAFAPFHGRALTLTPVAWLGRVSFSLYLVHMPILLTLAFAFGATAWMWAALLALPLSLLGAWGFSKAVEMPAHRLSRRVGALVRR